MDEKRQRHYQARADVLKALAHPSRLFIADTLREEERCVCELTELLGTDTSTVSKHLSILRNAGIVSSRKQGTTVYYRLICDCIAELLSAAETVIRRKTENEISALSS
jgi:ArsR family transcriptional regulator